METTERIVEAYCRYIKHWFTIPNIRVKNNEIDLIAVDKDGNKAQIEVGISISGGFSRLKNIAYDETEEKGSERQSSGRTVLGYFISRKFGSPEIVNELRGVYGFPEAYRKIIVVWGAEEDAVKAAEENGIEVWLMPELITEIEQQPGREIGFYRDDTIRTLYLAAKTSSFRKQQEARLEPKVSKGETRARGVPLKAWETFISNLPPNVTSKTYSIAQISKAIDYDLETEKSPVEHSPYWQSKHAHTEIWRKAGWKAKPVRDKDSKKIVAVKFVKVAQGKFI
jgi:hypothetical protein